MGSNGQRSGSRGTENGAGHGFLHSCECRLLLVCFLWHKILYFGVTHICTLYRLALESKARLYDQMSRGDIISGFSRSYFLFVGIFSELLMLPFVIITWIKVLIIVCCHTIIVYRHKVFSDLYLASAISCNGCMALFQMPNQQNHASLNARLATACYPADALSFPPFGSDTLGRRTSGGNMCRLMVMYLPQPNVPVWHTVDECICRRKGWQDGVAANCRIT